MNFRAKSLVYCPHMNVNLSPAMKEFVDRKLQAGEYQSAEQVLEAGLAILQQQETRPDFAPGELDALIAVGEADIAAGHVYDGEEVFRDLERMSAARRQGGRT